MVRGHRVVLAALLLVFAGCAGVAAPDIGAGSTDGGSATTADDGAGGNGTDGTLSVHFINVGQASATLVVGPTGETMLVDTGDYSDDGEHVLDYLRDRGIDRIDYLVTTHADADHIGGHAAVIEYYETQADGVGAVYDPGIAASTATYDEYLDAVEEHDVRLYETRAGDAIPMEGAVVDVLGPPDPYLDGGARNENNVALRVAYGDTSLLLPGDAEDDQERHLVETYGDDLNATLLAAGHHGSRTSSSGSFLDAVDPEAAVISSAYDSRYGHPNNETLRRLDERLIPTFWTAVHGDVVAESDGAEITVRTRQPATTEPLRLRGEPAVAPGNESDFVTRATLVDGGGGERTATETTTTDAATTTESATTTAADGGTDVRIAEINADAAGDDWENLNDEYVVLENAGDETLDLSGWTISDGSGETYRIPDGVALDPGETVTVHSGDGTDSETDLYWDAGRPVWNNGGDTVTIRNDEGERVVRRSYE
ncbi:MBL fold metallo-hydrolase [Halostella sp. JP-L12]|uniref:lamin tail domain-containing protein n=1 Tax=Halostella TaxID=1843185 RepID=UPI000EF7996D|nr:MULTISPECIES: lamin tail domain-containing protein [Halostella]NHN48648.1 MBL fold metallo-hydrolase [Halostella sp. JP-L12]